MNQDEDYVNGMYFEDADAYNNYVYDVNDELSDEQLI